MRFVHHVTQAAWRGDQDVTPSTKLIECDSHWKTTVEHAWAKHRAIAHTSGFIEDLHCQFPSRNDDYHERLSLDFMEASVVACYGGIWAWRRELLRLAHELRHNGNHVASRLARPWTCVSEELEACASRCRPYYLFERRPRCHGPVGSREWCTFG